MMDKLSPPQHRWLIHSSCLLLSVISAISFHITRTKCCKLSRCVHLDLSFLATFGMLFVLWVVDVKVKVAVTSQGTQSDYNYRKQLEKKSEKFPCEAEIHVDASRHVTAFSIHEMIQRQQCN